MDKEIYNKIIAKKEFSQLPKKDVELAFFKFDIKDYLDEEKIKLTRELLMKTFSVFASAKLLNIKDKDTIWLLKRHASTRERFEFYPDLYKRIFKNTKDKFTIFDLGAGMNGLSYGFFPDKLDFDYIGIEAMGQLVDLANYHFKTCGIENFLALHFSLFELEKIKKYLKQVKGTKIVFLFKALDSLEMLERNYSKKLLLEIVPLVDTLSEHKNLSRGKVVVSFATRSLIKKEKFKANKKWLVEFINENFKVIEDFELGGERYLSFR